jgi:hypothetical protein
VPFLTGEVLRWAPILYQYEKADLGVGLMCPFLTGEVPRWAPILY